MSTEQTQQFLKRETLSPREQGFVLAYTRIGSVSYGQPTACAIVAGYAESRAELTGSRLLKMPRILAAIAEIHQTLFDDFTASPARVMSDLENAKVMALAKNDRTSYIRLVELMGKSLCLWSEKSGSIETEQALELSEREKIEAKIIATICLLFGDKIQEIVDRRLIDPAYDPELRLETYSIEEIQKEISNQTSFKEKTYD